MSELFKTYLFIGLGGALGSMARFWVSVFIGERVQGSFPWGTILVNVLGSFIIGVLAAIADQPGKFSLTPATRQLLMVGICGGFTTFSSFSVQTLRLLQGGEVLFAISNVLFSVLICLLTVWGGHHFGQFLNR